jgi:hypothetical protein
VVDHVDVRATSHGLYRVVHLPIWLVWWDAQSLVLGML